MPHSTSPIGKDIQDGGYGLPRIPLLRCWVNKDNYARLRFLVNEEHPGTKPVRCGPEAGLGVHILRPTHFEELVCVGKLAGRERFTSTGIHYDVHSVSLLDEPPRVHKGKKKGRVLHPALSCLGLPYAARFTDK